MINTHLHAVTALGLFTLVVTTYLLMALFWPEAYIWATYEDLYGEWAQTWSFLLAGVFSVRLASMQTRYRWFFIMLAMACLYVVLEEISWGQRIIGFDTPELLKRYNLQREANIHNLLTGPVSTTTKDTIEKVMAAAFTLYGLIYPFLLKTGWSVARWFDSKGLAAPPLYLAPFFLTAAWLEISPIHFNEAEVAEILVGASLAIMTAHYRFSLGRGLNPHSPANWPTGIAKKLALTMVVITAVVSACSVITTSVLYADADKRARIDGRILNGYEKFARRYRKYGRPDIALQLLEHVHEQEPDRTSVPRRIAKIYKELGNDAQFLIYNQRAIDIGLERYQENPDSRSTNITLAYSYRQRGDTGNARIHAKQAYDLARKKVEENPDSAKAAYWLARAYRLRGDNIGALAEYKRAYVLKPGSKKYRRAYYSMRRKVPNVRIESLEDKTTPDTTE